LAETLKKCNRSLYNLHKVVCKVNRIKDLRVSKGWTQDQLGEKVGCSGVAIGRYERALRDLDVATICRLCEIFGCTADYLLGRSPVASPELSPEEEDLLLAWRAAPPEIRAIIDTALAPYREDADDPGAAAPTA
jgi:transcriptional regulator with XRE-family HTH domain